MGPSFKRLFLFVSFFLFSNYIDSLKIFWIFILRLPSWESQTDNQEIWFSFLLGLISWCTLLIYLKIFNDIYAMFKQYGRVAENHIFFKDLLIDWFFSVLVFIAVCGLSLVPVSSLLIAVASLAAEHRLWACRLQ